MMQGANSELLSRFEYKVSVTLSNTQRTSTYLYLKLT